MTPRTIKSEARSTRRPGRPANASSPLARDKLLDVALLRFSEHGVGATTLRDVATAAGFTPAMVSYYFGDRDALLDAVVAERLLPVLARLHAPLADKNRPLSALLQSFVEALFDTVSLHPWLPQLWVREILTESGSLRWLLIERIGPTLAKGMVAKFRAAQRRGEMRRDIDPQLLMLSLVGQTMFMAAALPLWRQVFDNQKTDLTALRMHVPALLETGWRAQQ